jgi:hypothetical protein
MVGRPPIHMGLGGGRPTHHFLSLFFFLIYNVRLFFSNLDWILIKVYVLLPN